MDRLIDKVIDELQIDCEHLLTSEQLDCIRYAIANYAVASQMDSSIVEEAVQVCNEYEENS